NIEKLEKTSVSNKKEYDALRTEIATINKSIRKLEDEILEGMSAAEDKTKAIPESEQALKKARADAAQFESEHQERLTLWSTERQTALEQLAVVEATIPEIIRP